MIWFDFLALGFIAYFVIRGLLSGFIKNFFSLVGMLVAFLYSGWLSLKLKPYIAHFINHPKGQLLISFLLAFLLIYITFLLLGFVIVLALKTMHISLGDRILGALFGFIKGALFTTFLYFLIVIPFPPARESLDRALTYPVVNTTTKVLVRFIPQSWIEFIKRSRKYYEIPKMFLN
ncbi:colicin V production protein [Caldimicrobium thiodismutans]|jgi:membrane protein required for colicin V production|uniref:Colicin V production protein n=1 Tax=Caldimicrobium thiodismutans TaxID=1653476 RepID=A0A0U5ASM8_9BACT|nr:CvpA family protein [Caldimicrobium thiodismutans]BAU23953.1 colicin V production protein [Caldimicrobium thiodismutans]